MAFQPAAAPCRGLKGLNKAAEPRAVGAAPPPEPGTLIRPLKTFAPGRRPRGAHSADGLSRLTWRPALTKGADGRCYFGHLPTCPARIGVGARAATNIIGFQPLAPWS